MNAARRLPLAAILAAGALLAPRPMAACPFCAAEQRTLTEEMASSSAVVLARLIRPGAVPQLTPEDGVPYSLVDPASGAAEFHVERVLQGQELLAGAERIEAVYYGEPNTETMFLVRGVATPPEWTIPLPLSEAAVAYVERLTTLPPSGADRLAFFQDYLEHEDPLLAQDSYDEFARAPYADLIALEGRMDRPRLLEWITGAKTSPTRRRLFLTMLGVCGKAEDVPLLRGMLASDERSLGSGADAAAAALLSAGAPLGLVIVPEGVRYAERQRKLGLDAMIACYLTLAAKHQGDPAAGDGVEGALSLVDRRFLTNPDADHSHVYSAMMALRFLAEEQQHVVPRERVLQSARLLLDNPDFADQVIPDLARWEDWSVLERLGLDFEESVRTGANRYVREPIVTYLDVASEVEGEVGARARGVLARVEPLDPESAKRARSLRAFGFLAQAKTADPSRPPAGAGRPAETTAAGEESPPGPPAPAVDITPEDSSVAADSGPGPGAEGDPADFPALTPDGAPAPPPGPLQTAGPAVETPGGEAPAARGPNVLAPAPVAPAAPPPPSRLLLVGAPLAGAVALVGLFWLILRGGAA